MAGARPAPRRRVAGAHHAGVPQPFVDALAIGIAGDSARASRWLPASSCCLSAASLANGEFGSAALVALAPLEPRGLMHTERSRVALRPIAVGAASRRGESATLPAAAWRSPGGRLGVPGARRAAALSVGAAAGAACSRRQRLLGRRCRFAPQRGGAVGLRRASSVRPPACAAVAGAARRRPSAGRGRQTSIRPVPRLRPSSRQAPPQPLRLRRGFGQRRRSGAGRPPRPARLRSLGSADGCGVSASAAGDRRVARPARHLSAGASPMLRGAGASRRRHRHSAAGGLGRGRRSSRGAGAAASGCVAAGVGSAASAGAPCDSRASAGSRRNLRPTRRSATSSR